jgi:glycosyltransferase involved in cell wall biosynthesis/predicted O-methyltransferase YrrM
MTQRKHVVLYTDDPDEGGVAAYTHSVACGLARAGYEVTCVQSEPRGPLALERSALGVKHHWLGFHTRHDHARNATNTEDARLAFAATRPDVVLFANCSPFSHVAAKTVAAAAGLPTIIVEGYVAPYDTVTPEVAWHLHHAARHYEQARAVIAVSADNLDLLHSHYALPAGKGEVIHYGRPAAYFGPPRPEVRARLRQEHGIPDEAVVCLTVGRLEAVKGYQLQLEALRRLKETSAWPRLTFVWIGQGSLGKEIADALNHLGVADRVKVLGQRWDVADWLDASDVFLLPSWYEGMPLVIMEAMAKGLPVLASAVSGIPEELGETGKLLPSPHHGPEAVVRAMVDALQAWAADAHLRTRVGAAGRDRAVRLFREERMVHDTVQVVERALLPRGDYVSPGMDVVRLDGCFPHLAVGDPEKATWPYLRRGIPHNWYIDGRAPDTGFSNRDEAHILYNTALRFRGRHALEIGCWLGWSLCHLASAGLFVDVIDPVLGRPDFLANVRQSLQAAGALDRVNFVAGFSPGQVHALSRQLNRRWPFFFIDGNHEPPYPVFDAAVCAEHAEADAVILFHDLASPHVADGLEYLRQCGWNVMVYLTAQIMGVAWRGNVRPVSHVPDPSVAWHLPHHLRTYPVSGRAAAPGP